MQDMRPREVPRGGSAEPPRAAARRVVLAAGMLSLILAGQGCSSTITTPLPTTAPTVTSSISQQDRKKEMDELQSKAATHEADAERQIENSR
jgi:hypothetical protein